jgi:hypothetical protein
MIGGDCQCDLQDPIEYFELHDERTYFAFDHVSQKGGACWLAECGGITLMIDFNLASANDINTLDRVTNYGVYYDWRGAIYDEDKRFIAFARRETEV